MDLQSCGACTKFLSDKSAWSNQKFVANNDLSFVAVLIRGHTFHAECLETMTAEANKPEPYGAGVGVTPKEILETANINLPCNTTRCQNSSKSKKTVSVTIGLVLASIVVSTVGLLAFTMYRRPKQKLGSAFDITESRLSTDQTNSFIAISSTLGKFGLFGWSIPMQRSLRV
ncbi:hypothetical protein KIW84_014120 [Lathyrus oleraceus]|uniref:Uncharacterized protein n=1 Tax=Pisum sativum TaxID=3888 RepID=A0A9D5BLV0_PEA|nr:hypothetical protein KIW84_014120 [Pisum sativum]